MRASTGQILLVMWLIKLGRQAPQESSNPLRCVKIFRNPVALQSKLLPKQLPLTMIRLQHKVQPGRDPDLRARNERTRFVVLGSLSLFSVHDNPWYGYLIKIGTCLKCVILSQGDGKSSKKPELATVVAPYSASGKEQVNVFYSLNSFDIALLILFYLCQLTLIKGQMILVRKKTDTGWWQGEIQAVRIRFVCTLW